MNIAIPGEGGNNLPWISDFAASHFANFIAAWRAKKAMKNRRFAFAKWDAQNR
jgi:hypothetical protein